MNKKVQKLSIFLLKENIHQFSDCVQDWNGYAKHDLNPEFNLNGKIVIGPKTEDPATWASFLADGTNEKLDINNLINSSSRAVILINLDGIFLAISFGFGRFLLNEEHIDKNFGLKVVLNAVDENKIKTVELATLSDNTVLTRKQSTRKSSKEIFGIDLLNNLMCAVSGQPTNSALYGKVISGREQVIISPKVDFTNLKEVLEGLLVLHSSILYKKNFAWVDDIMPLKDKTLLEYLDNQLVDAICTKNFEYLDISVPQISEEDTIDGYKFTKNGETFPEPAILDFINSFQDGHEIDCTTLKRRYLYVIDAQSSSALERWRIYNCLHFQSTINGKFYILFGGQWYIVDGKLIDHVMKYLNVIISKDNFHFSCNKSWGREDQYNENFANSDLEKYVLLDKKLVKCESARTNIESCDIFSVDKVFYHIKPKKSSSSLSHLFAQGKISAEAFLKDTQYRRELRRKIRSIKPNFSDLIPTTTQRPKAEDYKIVFGIIDSSSLPLEKSLPFFSQLNLVLSYQHLKMLGFNVSAVKIPKL